MQTRLSEDVASSGILEHRIKVSTSGITTINIYSDQKDNRYFVEEDITFTAEFGNPSAIANVRWQKNVATTTAVSSFQLRRRENYRLELEHFSATENVRLQNNENIIIDTSMSNKYKETRNNNRSILVIRSCSESDTGSYSVLVTCKANVDIYSNSVDIKVVEGRPDVALNKVPSAYLYDCVKMIAAIRSYPKHYSVIWKKGNDPIAIDINLPKYAGSSVVGDRPVLCINDTIEDDGDIYTIEVKNQYGIGTSTEELFVIGVRKMLLISGPAVVSPNETLEFRTVLPDTRYSQARWWKITEQSTTEIQFGTNVTKYFIYHKNKTVKMEITNAEEGDSAAYQFSLDHMKSNKIHTFVDDSGKYSAIKKGNCLRLFALQDVSANAMRKVFKDQSDFEEKKMEWKRNCEQKSRNHSLLNHLGNKTLRDVDISLMYAILRYSVVPKPKNGWGKPPGENDIDAADDIERLHQCRNLICHTDASGMDITLFNAAVVDLHGAIRRLSGDDVKLIKETCDILNKVFVKGNDLNQMMEKLETFKKEQRKIDELIAEYHSNTPNTDVKFHDVCDSDIEIKDDGTLAFKIQYDQNGVCFMNRPMTCEDEVYLHGSQSLSDLIYIRNQEYIGIGLTNKNPDKFRSSENKMEIFESTLLQVPVFQEGLFSSRKFALRIALRRGAVLSMILNGNNRFHLSYPEVSTKSDIWLVIQPNEINSIKISNII